MQLISILKQIKTPLNCAHDFVSNKKGRDDRIV